MTKKMDYIREVCLCVCVKIKRDHFPKKNNVNEKNEQMIIFVFDDLNYFFFRFFSYDNEQ